MYPLRRIKKQDQKHSQVMKPQKSSITHESEICLCELAEQVSNTFQNVLKLFQLARSIEMNDLCEVWAEHGYNPCHRGGVQCLSLSSANMPWKDDSPIESQNEW